LPSFLLISAKRVQILGHREQTIRLGIALAKLPEEGGTKIMKTVVGVFNDFTAATNALPDVVHEGIARDHISIMTPDTEGEFAKYLSMGTGRPVTEDAGIGAVVGGLGGLLVGLGALTIPGVGPILAAGPLFTALAGAIVGAEAGSLVGVLNGFGIAEYEAKSHAEKVGEGRTLVIVKAEEPLAGRAQMILRRHHAVNVEQHEA
jgi:hypothetical protein